nr:NERD domain-containing protein [uncultured Bacillus sp.]
MGQLIKLQNYTSRYEQNIFHYPARFVTLKKQQWEKWQYIWGNSREQFSLHQPVKMEYEGLEEEKKHPLLEKFKTLFQKKRESEIDSETREHDSFLEDRGAWEFAGFPSMVQLPETIEELKQVYLNHLFHVQLMWATSTLTEKSIFNKKYYFDEHLKYFLQRFPDTYLIMYRPVFLLKNAPIELENILISPTNVWCIVFLEDHDLSVFTGSKEKFWELRSREKVKKILNPLISLNRTEKIVNNILQLNEVDIPVHKVLLSRNGYMDYPSCPFDVRLVDKSKYDEWFQSMRTLRSPLKSTQLKAAKALLEFCETTSMKRQEWEDIEE